MQCEFVHEVWGPHEGCKEFMDTPETFPCTNQATTMTMVHYSGPDENYDWVTADFPMHGCHDHPVTEDYVSYTDKILWTVPIDGSEF